MLCSSTGHANFGHDRWFLAGAAATAGAFSASLSAIQPSFYAPDRECKRASILGRAAWLGPVVVRVGIARGPHFTLIYWGKSNPTIIGTQKDTLEKRFGPRRRPKRGPVAAAGPWSCQCRTRPYRRHQGRTRGNPAGEVLEALGRMKGPFHWAANRRAGKRFDPLWTPPEQLSSQACTVILFARFCFLASWLLAS